MLTIGGVAIGADNPCRFVAELSCNHGGSLDRALRLVTAAKDAGADFVKLQCYTPDELVALRGDGPAPSPWGEQGFTMRTLYERAMTPRDWFPVIAEYCRDLEIVWFSSAFGMESLALLESLNCPAYKLAALDRKQAAFVRAVRATKKPTLRSCRADKYGMADVRRYAKKDLLLYCEEGYPQASFPHLSPWMFMGSEDGFVEEDFSGFSYHGTDIEIPKAAAHMGAQIIEAHFQLDDEPSELEANVSLRASDFARMVADVRRVEAML